MTAKAGLLAQKGILPGIAQPVLDAALMSLALLSGLTLFDSVFWLADNLNFFRPLLFYAALVVLCAALMMLRWLRVGLAMLLVAFNALPLMVRAIPAPVPAAEGELSVRVMSANVLSTNADYASFRRVVSEIQPDVLVTQEAFVGWARALQDIDFLPYRATEPGSEGGLLIGDNQILSRFPLEWEQLDPSSRTGLRLIPREVAARLKVRPPTGNPFVIYAVHPPSPRTFFQWQRRTIYLDEIARLVRAEPPGTSILVVGDWNTPPWSPVLRRFAADTRLVSTEELPWPPSTRILAVVAGVALLGSSVDRIMVSPDVGLAGLHLGPAFGSDHLPIYVDLMIP